MAQEEEVRHASTTLGFRVKSGWATAVLLAGPVKSPRVLDRRAIDLCDPAIAKSRQPYHARMGELETDEKELEERCTIVRAAAARSVATLLKEYRQAGHLPRAAGIVVGSQIDPAKITNSHIRAHALEGRLFRTVLEEPLATAKLACLVVSERNVYSVASEKLGRTQDELKTAVALLGKSLGGPWRADEKGATLAAWQCLAQ
jgi:hypothetical protein